MNRRLSQIYHSEQYYVKLCLKRNFMNFYIGISKNSNTKKFELTILNNI